MSAIPQTNPAPLSVAQPQLVHNLAKKPITAPAPSNAVVVPTKLAIFGEQGTGKTTTACLYAAALSEDLLRWRSDLRHRS